MLQSPIVTCIQMVSVSDVEKNLVRVEALVNNSVSRGAKLVVLPENFAAYGHADIRKIGREEGGENPPIRSFIQQLAKKYGIWIVAGTIPVCDSDDERPFAACWVIDDCGEVAGRYDKIHLFDAQVNDAHGAYRESNSYRPGEKLTVIDTPLGKLGIAVCYDLRFPEMFRMMRDQGAELIAVPSAFTHVTGMAHWEILCRARAIENSCYILACNQGGWHDEKRRTWGHSMIVDPWGGILGGIEEGEYSLSAEIPLHKIAEIRAQLPTQENRRFGSSELSES